MNDTAKVIADALAGLHRISGENFNNDDLPTAEENQEKLNPREPKTKEQLIQELDAAYEPGVRQVFFEGSTVKDDKGDPRVVFMQDSEFDGLYTFGSNGMTPAYINIKKPLYLDNLDYLKSLLAEDKVKYPDKKSGQALKDMLSRDGYDGVSIRNEIYIPLSDEQIMW